MADDHSHEGEQERVQHKEQAPAQAGGEQLFAPEVPLSASSSLLGDSRLNNRGNAPVRASVMQQMQQGYGNHAVQRFLQRTPLNVPVQRDPPHGAAAPAAAATSSAGSSGAAPPTTTGLNAGMIEVQGGQPQLSGSVQAHPGPGSDKVTVESPPITFDASASLKPDVNLGSGESVRVGPVQTLLGSTRTGVYRKGGARDGEVLAEQQSAAGQVRDATWDPGDNGPTAAVEAPWYSNPSTLSDSVRQANVHYMDQPGFELPTVIGEGKLTETRGEDRFTTSIAAKRGDTLVHLQSSHWEVPWNVQIENSQGQGSAVTGASTIDAPPTTDGQIAVAAGEDWIAYRTIDTAMSASNTDLMNNLIPTKAHDRDAWANVVEALRRKNPTFSVTIAVGSTASVVGSDNLQVRVRGHQQLQRGPFSLNDGQATTVTFRLNDLFDPAAIDRGSTIEVEVQDVGTVFNNDPARMSWGYPFPPQADPARMQGGGGGHYTVTGHFS